jgi:hypothetical protein
VERGFFVQAPDVQRVLRDVRGDYHTRRRDKRVRFGKKKNAGAKVSRV